MDQRTPARDADAGRPTAGTPGCPAVGKSDDLERVQQGLVADAEGAAKKRTFSQTDSSM